MAVTRECPVQTGQADTPCLSGFSNRTLPHESQQALCSPVRGTWSPVGKPVASPQERSVPAMPQNLSGDISEVKFLTVAEVAATMRVSKMTVYRLVHSGELPAVQVGRSFRINEDDVNEYLRKSFYSAG
jgi:excisionase family DNA binding protein